MVQPASRRLLSNSYNNSSKLDNAVQRIGRTRIDRVYLLKRIKCTLTKRPNWSWKRFYSSAIVRSDTKTMRGFPYYVSVLETIYSLVFRLLNSLAPSQWNWAYKRIVARELNNHRIKSAFDRRSAGIIMVSLRFDFKNQQYSRWNSHKNDCIWKTSKMLLTIRNTSDICALFRWSSFNSRPPNNHDIWRMSFDIHSPIKIKLRDIYEISRDIHFRLE